MNVWRLVLTCVYKQESRAISATLRNSLLQKGINSRWRSWHYSILCIDSCCSLYRYWDQRSFRISINIEEHYKFTLALTSSLFHAYHYCQSSAVWKTTVFFYFHEVHFRFRCTCKKLWYLYSRPHLGQIWTCFPPGIELEAAAAFLKFLVSRKDFNLSARRVIWLLKFVIILGWTSAGCSDCSTST